MNVLNYSKIQANLEEVMDQVVDDCAPVVIAREHAEPVVMMSLKEWNSIEETLYLLSSPRNADYLRASIRELEAGGGEEHQLLDP